MTPEETANRWRWSAIVVGLLIGGALVALGFIDGSAWTTFAGYVLTGGSGIAGVRTSK